MGRDGRRLRHGSAGPGGCPLASRPIGRQLGDGSGSEPPPGIRTSEQTPTLLGLHLVVHAAQTAEVVEGRGTSPAVVTPPMVDLQALRRGAAGHDAMLVA